MNGKKTAVILCLSLGMLFCCGCRAEVRERAYAEVLAVHTEARVKGTVRYDTESAPVTGTADTPALLTEALQTESGKSMYTGHLSMLLLSGEPQRTFADLTAGQWLSPNCLVLYTAQNAANLLAKEDTDYEAKLRQATATGQLPSYDAADVFAHWTSGTGIAALPYYRQETFAIALCAEDAPVAVLSQNACRGLALLADEWETFSLAVVGQVHTAAVALTQADMVMRLSENDGQLSIALHCKAKCKPSSADMGDAPQQAAEQALSDLLAAAMHETLSAGADLCCLREAAIRDGISWAKEASQTQWRDALQQATYTITVEAVIG